MLLLWVVLAVAGIGGMQWGASRASAALDGATVGDVPLYLANLAFLGFVLVTYTALKHARRGEELGPGRVALFAGGYAAYLAAVAYLLAG
jgi:hypothetical protein